MILLDTNVISELMRADPDERVVAWVETQPAGDLATTAVTVAEVRHGIARLPEGRRREVLRAAADQVFAAHGNAVHSFDTAAVAVYAEVVSGRERAGEAISGFDAQIAAIALVRGAGLATRNTRDFVHLGLQLVDPWEHIGAED